MGLIKKAITYGIILAMGIGIGTGITKCKTEREYDLIPKDALKKKIESSRDQSDDSQPYILAINANDMLGSLTENLRYLAKSFQPKMNTRFSGILLVNNTLNGNGKEKIDLKYVSNPYSKYPISKNVEMLFIKK